MDSRMWFSCCNISFFVFTTGVIITGMTADAVFARLRGRPFVPFRLILTSGTTHDVMHPEMLFVSKSGLTIAIYDRDQKPSPGGGKGDNPPY